MSRYRFYDNGSKVIAVSSYAGRPVRGVAKCDPRDSFDVIKGKDLAEARCNVKVAQKRMERSTKCYDEAAQSLFEAEKHFRKMQSYFQDSQQALIKAENHLNEVMKSM